MVKNSVHAISQWGQGYSVCVHAKSLQLCLTLCNPMDCSLPGSSIHGILQARIMERVACLPPGHLHKPGITTSFLMLPALAGRFFTISTTCEVQLKLKEWLENLVYVISQWCQGCSRQCLYILPSSRVWEGFLEELELGQSSLAM